MKNPIDLEAAVRRVVANEVNAAFGPYRDVLEGLVNFAAAKAAAPSPAPATAPAPRVKAAPKSRAKAAPQARRSQPGTAVEDVSKFAVGQAVHYRQGRGQFEAVVAGIDPARGLLTVERVADGKKVERAPSKVIVGGAAAAAPKAPAAKTVAPKAKPALKAKAKPRAGAEDVSKFAVGQIVLYRQGRGQFEAVVTGIDAAQGLLTLERPTDRKKVERAPSNVVPVSADASAPAPAKAAKAKAGRPAKPKAEAKPKAKAEARPGAEANPEAAGAKYRYRSSQKNESKAS